MKILKTFITVLFILAALAILSLPFTGFFRKTKPTIDSTLQNHYQTAHKVDSEEVVVGSITKKADSIRLIYIPKIKKIYETTHDSIVCLPTDAGISYLADQLSKKDSIGFRYGNRAN